MIIISNIIVLVLYFQNNTCCEEFMAKKGKWVEDEAEKKADEREEDHR